MPGSTLPPCRCLGIDPQREILMLNAPGRSVTLHPARDSPVAAFIFWQPEISGLDHQDSARHKRIVLEAFGGLP